MLTCNVEDYHGVETAGYITRYLYVIVPKLVKRNEEFMKYSLSARETDALVTVAVTSDC
jgi:hypothetical protein